MNKFKSEHKQLGIFVTAGYPELNATAEQIQQLAGAKIDFIEIGIPFSDPMADGPVIQESSARALQNGMNLEKLFDQLLTVKDVPTNKVLMGYLNPVLCYGMERFLSRCVETDVSGVILPDISIEIYERFYAASFEKFGIQCIFLITADTPEERLKRIAQHTKKGFVYLTSSNQTTGSQDAFSLVNREKMAELRTIFGATPIFIGFGIKNKKMVEQVQSLADGAIIGSAYIQAIEKNQDKAFLQEIF